MIPRGDPDRARLAPPFYDPVEAPYHPFGWQREVDLDPQPLAVEIIQHVQKPERTTIYFPAVVCMQTMRGPEAIRHEVPLRRLLRKSLPGSASTRSHSAHLARPKGALSQTFALSGGRLMLQSTSRETSMRVERNGN